MTDFEKQLKDKVNSYQIKTSADDVLSTFKNQHVKVKQSIFQKPIFKFSLFGGSFAMAAILVGVLVPWSKLFKPTGVDVFIPAFSEKEKSLLNNQIGILSFNVGDESNLHNLIKYSSNSDGNTEDVPEDTNIPKEEYKLAVDAFDISSKSLYFIDNDIEKDITSKTTELTTPFVESGTSYYFETVYFKNNVELYKTYLNYVKESSEDENEWKFTGLLKTSTETFIINGSKELSTSNNKEYELETTIVDKSYIYTVEKEIEVDESGYEFHKTDLKGEDVYKYEIASEADEAGYEVVVDDKETYEYKVQKASTDKYTVTYKSDLIINLEYTANSRIYTSDNQDTITKI
ncbi:MAG: hypothetical protein RR342_03620 [Bacilli bacterium]